MIPAHDLASLIAFAAALRLGEDGTILLDEIMVGRTVGAARADTTATGGPIAASAAGQTDHDAPLASALMRVVYEHAYARAYTGDRSPPEPAPEAHDLTIRLERANASRSRTEQGWLFSGSESNGSVIAVRHGRTRRFVPGQFLAIDGVLPLRTGSALVAQIPGGSTTAQPGFYYAFGEGFRDVNDLGPVVRLYWNVRIDGAVGLLGALTALLNRYRLPFDFKIVVRSADYARRDCAVLYIARDLFTAVSTVILAAYPAFAAYLDDPVPLFAKRLAPGLGLAEDPGDHESFGMARSRLVAQALAAARAGDRFSTEMFARTLAAAITAAGLRADAPWLNAGSDDIYTVSPPSSHDTAARSSLPASTPGAVHTWRPPPLEIG